MSVVEDAPLLEAGQYDATIVEIDESKEPIETTYKGTTTREYKVDLTLEVENNGDVHTLRRRMNRKATPKSSLRKTYRNVMGEDKSKFEINDMLYKRCRVSVVLNPDRDGRMWSNIDEILGASETTLEE